MFAISNLYNWFEDKNQEQLNHIYPTTQSDTMLLQVVLLFILKHSSDIYVQSFVICPYCDPNHMAYPNMEEAVRGYDVPMGNPNPGRGESDPGIRNQIFNPMVRNSDGYYKLDGSWISANTQIKVISYNLITYQETKSLHRNIQTFIEFLSLLF